MGDRKGRCLEGKKKSDASPGNLDSLTEEVKIQPKNKVNPPRKVEKKTSESISNVVSGKTPSLPAISASGLRQINNSGPPHRQNPGTTVDTVLIKSSKTGLSIRKPLVPKPLNFRPEIERLHDNITRNNGVTFI